MKTRMLVLAFAASTLVASGAAIANAEGRPGMYSADATELVPILSANAADSDPRPAVIDLADTDLDILSLRYFGDSDLGRHWVASDKDGAVCLLTEAAPGSGAGGVGGIACTPAGGFYQLGASLRLEGAAEEGVVAHLLPPDVAASEVSASLAAARDSAQVSADANGELLDREGSVILVQSTADADRVGVFEVARGSATEGITIYPMSGINP